MGTAVAFLGRDLRQRTVTQQQLAAQSHVPELTVAGLSLPYCPVADANGGYVIDTVGKLHTTNGGQT